MTAIGKAQKARKFARDTVVSLLADNHQTVSDLDQCQADFDKAEKTKKDTEKKLKDDTKDRDDDHKKFKVDRDDLDISISGITNALEILSSYYGTVSDTE